MFSGEVNATGFFTPSARWLKTDIRPLDNPLDTIMNLQGVRFHWQETGAPSLGFIAGDVTSIVLEAVSPRPSGEAFGLDCGRLTVFLVEGLRQQQREIDAIQQDCDRLAARLEKELKKR